MHISEIIPVRDSNGAPRALFAGMNGTGKTTLMQKCLVEMRKDVSNFMIIFDTDHMWNFQPMRTWKYKAGIPILFTKVEQLNSFTSGIFIYRPNHPAIYDPNVDKILNWSMKRGNVDIVIDEINDFHKNGEPTDELGRCIKQGRKRQVLMLYGAQRVHKIPLICISESRYFYIFHMKAITDRERMRDEVDELMIIPPDFENHDLWLLKPGYTHAKYINGMTGDRTPVEVGYVNARR